MNHWLVDNQGSGYLGMARCFNVHRQLPVSKETHISAQKNVRIKLGAPVKRAIFNVSFYKLKHLQVILQPQETSVQNRILF